MITTELHTLTVAKDTFSYILERKPVKNINLRIKKDGTIAVSAPPLLPISHIERFLMLQIDFIRRAMVSLAQRKESSPSLSLLEGEQIPIYGVLHTIHLQKGSKRGAKIENGHLLFTLRDPHDKAARYAVFASFLDAEARRTLTAATQAHLSLFAPIPNAMPTLTFRTMTSKWGICRPGQARITLNRNLIYLPPPLIDYVICHELAHFRHPNHSVAFWQYLQQIMPDCKERRKKLNQFPIPTFSF